MPRASEGHHAPKGVNVPFAGTRTHSWGPVTQWNHLQPPGSSPHLDRRVTSSPHLEELPLKESAWAHPPRKQTADTTGTEEEATLRYHASWDEGAAQVTDARRSLRAFLAHAPRTGRQNVPSTLAMDAELAVSELVTNAVRHTRGPCGMTLRLSGEELTITVWDSSTEKPAPKKADPRRIGGHGLHLVETVSKKVVVALRATGKRITAHLLYRSTPAGSAEP
ncbi:ATP-binding protein [Streptomyces sp. SCL15-4]|uniref:ATP-binding protein n=1 Tax=Streptomyces sp. SCL15-4 TaxID=2967221 RepID=UPI002967725A|nr:ATP-binding protein [Streptomyces sp. SCL15-4]